MFSDISWKLVVTIVICTWGAFSSLSYYATIGNNLQSRAQPFFNSSCFSHYGVYMSDSLFSTLWPLAVSIYYIGAIIGSMPIGIIAERLGRRNGLFLAASLSSVFAVLSSLSPVLNSFELYLASRVLLGFSCGLQAGILPMYLAEISPTDKRGSVGAVVQIFVAVGILFGTSMGLPQLLGRDYIWPMSLMMPGFITFFELIWLLFCPGSPRHLYLTLNKPAAAERSVQFFQGADAVKGYMHGLKEEHDANTMKSMSPDDKKTLSAYQVIWEPSVRRNLLVSLVIIIGMQMDGSAGVFGFSHDVFIDAGMTESKSQLASVGVGISVLISAIISVIIMDKVGRRKLILVGYITQFLCLCGIQICKCGIQYFAWTMWAEYCLMVGIYVFVSGYSIKSCVVFVAISELFPQKARSGAMTVNMMLNWFLNWFTVFAFIPWQNLTQAWSFMPYLVGVLIVVIVTYLYLPETSGKELYNTNQPNHELTYGSDSRAHENNGFEKDE